MSALIGILKNVLVIEESLGNKLSHGGTSSW
jgi:hypothetical protein